MSNKGLFALVFVGIIIALIALFLVINGNPPNMGVCVACFVRDTAGALRLQTAPPVQYMRPEIFGFISGAFFSALCFKTFHPRAGSTPLIHLMLGFLMMVGCLVFLGCPLRMLLRIGAGDLNAVIGLLGLVVGIGMGCFFLHKKFSLPANQKQKAIEGLIFPIICLVIVGLILLVPTLFAQSTIGPGSMHASIFYSLIAGLIIGIAVERTNFCTIGFISHIFLFRRFSMLIAVIALVATISIGTLYLGAFKLGFNYQPIAHTDGLWNFLSMVLVGICGVFLGGCPLRQLVKSGKADGDATITIMGMLLGAAVAHNFSLASVAQSIDASGGATLGGKIVIVMGLILVVIIGITYSKFTKTTEIN